MAICERLYDWQTLTGALIALIAALGTICVMRSQMRKDADRHRDAQRRKQMAARAQMPDALSALAAYVRACGAQMFDETQPKPEMPLSAVSALKGVIEFIEDSAAVRTFELVSWHQVFQARGQRGLPDRGLPEFSDRIYDATLLQAYINSLFEYARNEAVKVENSKPSREEMNTALKSAFDIIHRARHEELFARVQSAIERRHQ